jgi:hypothetical protein
MPSQGACWAFSQFHEHNTEGTPVKLVSAQEIIRTLECSGPGLLKLDIEGSELVVLRDLGKELERFEIIVGEIHLNQVDLFEVYDLLRRHYVVEFEQQFGGMAVQFRASKKPWKAYV